MPGGTVYRDMHGFGHTLGCDVRGTCRDGRLAWPTAESSPHAALADEISTRVDDRKRGGPWLTGAIRMGTSSKRHGHGGKDVGCGGATSSRLGGSGARASVGDAGRLGALKMSSRPRHPRSVCPRNPLPRGCAPRSRAAARLGQRGPQCAPARPGCCARRGGCAGRGRPGPSRTGRGPFWQTCCLGRAAG